MYDLLTANAECSSQALVDVVLGCFPGRGLFLDLPFELSFVPCALSPLCLHPLSCRGFCRAHLGHSLWILGHLDFSQASCWLIHLLILTFVSLSLLLTVDFELTCMSDRLSQDLRDLTQAIQQLTIVTRGLASQTGSASDGVQSSASSSPRSSFVKVRIRRQGQRGLSRRFLASSVLDLPHRLPEHLQARSCSKDSLGVEEG